MAFLIDTNILLRLLQPHHPKCTVVGRALAELRRRPEVLHITAQNLIEFWAVATRPPSENGLGMTVEVAFGELTVIKRLFLLLPKIPVLDEWERLVRVHRVSGKNTYDDRLVAAMKVHGIGNILTLNVQDFTRYEGIPVVSPDTLAV
jgi:predicted nucleic acid-binding protein